MTFTALRMELDEELREIMLAELSQQGFDSFQEGEDFLEAYILTNELLREELDKLFTRYQIPAEKISLSEIEKKNWNKEWESNYPAIRISDRCYIRAPFHPEEEVQYDIIIEPKMSFGTGHHATTQMAAELLLDECMEGKTVLDMGCGTGILAILSKKLGATKVDGIDIEDWAVANTIENCNRNGASEIHIKLGDSSIITGKYDLIIANINLNVLLNDLSIYSAHLYEHGRIILSGFYQDDLMKIERHAGTMGFETERSLTKENWCCTILARPFHS